jgi:hypothetical protein
MEPIDLKFGHTTGDDCGRCRPFRHNMGFPPPAPLIPCGHGPEHQHMVEVRREQNPPRTVQTSMCDVCSPEILVEG